MARVPHPVCADPYALASFQSVLPVNAGPLLAAPEPGGVVCLWLSAGALRRPRSSHGPVGLFLVLPFLPRKTQVLGDMSEPATQLC